MYPLIRLLTSSIKARLSSSISINDPCETTFRCRPWDLDMFMEVNNGRMLTLYDIGRFDLSIRCGLSGVLRRNRWGFAVAGSSVRYRRRVRMFDRVTLRTQLVGMDDRWSYIAQSMWVKGQPVSSVLLRTTVTSKNGSVPTQKVLEEMGLEQWQTELPEWVRAWTDGDEQRPWPPEP
ncbi:acyl-CoA thioesterase [Endozoicomonas euniceicola]|uniref:Acyl-CoA thioesterase n=1 Tax=Endozoicomonas euniceicola TaxID=1234143 RepID=A0ABY6GR55_9GAMM|nr:acyl-CoA thioesterase [Endozoicomonas euniceicola]UYM15237.1 acyl-CoA thioesterase [Endozoicomonas euniceicola]